MFSLPINVFFKVVFNSFTYIADADGLVKFCFHVHVVSYFFTKFI